MRTTITCQSKKQVRMQNAKLPSAKMPLLLQSTPRVHMKKDMDDHLPICILHAIWFGFGPEPDDVLSLLWPQHLKPTKCAWYERVLLNNSSNLIHVKKWSCERTEAQLCISDSSGNLNLKFVKVKGS